MGIARTAFLSLLLLAAPALALANPDPVKIKFVTPETKKKLSYNWQQHKFIFETIPTLQYYDGFPLTIKLELNNELGITISEGGEPFFPHRGLTGYVIFADPDGVLCMDSANWNDIGAYCIPENEPAIESDETYLEFTPDIDDIGLPDNAGNDMQRMRLVDDFSAGLSGFNTWIGAPTGVLEDVYLPDGTPDGEIEIVDGYGRGADDDLPGLVLITQQGMGVVWDDDFSMKLPMELVNLAGYTNTVSYGLNDRRSKTYLMAHMVVPASLFAPLAVFDTCYTNGAPITVDDPNTPEDETEANCKLAWKVEGGEVAEILDIGLGVKYAPKGPYREVFENTVSTVSAFVVSGQAPDRVTDMNGDLVIDDNDLVLMGYDVLGSKKSVSFKQVGGDACFGPFGGSLIIGDIDGNGLTGILDICGPNSGSITKVPR